MLGAENIGSVLVFDDSYVSQFVFQRDEVLKNSFDIFIKTETFKTAMEEIEALLAGIKSAFDGNEALSSAISDLKEVRDAFGVTKSGALSKASKGYKAFGSGNKIENIPPQLKPFEAFIKSEQPASWIAWQAKGNTFLDLSDNCPYCASDLREPEKKDTVKQVAKEYDSKAIEHLNGRRSRQSSFDSENISNNHVEKVWRELLNPRLSCRWRKQIFWGLFVGTLRRSWRNLKGSGQSPSLRFVMWIRSKMKLRS